MGLTLHQAEVLANLADEHKCITQVSHQRRTSPLLFKMKDACNAHGPVTHAVCEFYKWSPQPMLGARDRMMDDGVHAIDTLRWMCGGEVIGLDSEAKRVGTGDINWLAALLYFDNGSTGALLCNWASGRRVFRVEMHSPGAACDAEVEGKAYLYEDGDYDGNCYDAKEVAGNPGRVIFVASLAGQGCSSQRQLTCATPLGGAGCPDDVAGAVLCLPSPLASFVTGEVLDVNGGQGFS